MTGFGPEEIKEKAGSGSDQSSACRSSRYLRKSLQETEVFNFNLNTANL